MGEPRLDVSLGAIVAIHGRHLDEVGFIAGLGDGERSPFRLDAHDFQMGHEGLIVIDEIVRVPPDLDLDTVPVLMGDCVVVGHLFLLGLGCVLQPLPVGETGGGKPQAAFAGGGSPVMHAGRPGIPAKARGHRGSG